MTKKSLTEQEFLDKVDATYTADESALIRKAYFCAKEKHAGQKRKSGEDYIIHPMAVAEIVIQMGMDVATVEAALLHDVLEDTPCTHDEMKAEFGEEVVFLVEGVTKLAKINFSGKQQAQAENLRKMLLAMCHDLRVVILKLADRLHNMRTLGNVEPEKQIETAQETLDVYAPLAARLGIMQIKSELEDLCMRYLYPAEYNQLREIIASKKNERDAFVARMIEQLDAALKTTDLKYEINGRSKHFYSIYRKMQRLQCGIDEIYDLVALRVIVDGEPNRCYDVLGMVHNLWKPLLGRFKDYISTPKPNNYQSLHTTVLAPGGAPFEVQIRTREMHRIAEYGVAAHWKYKDGKTEELRRELISNVSHDLRTPLTIIKGYAEMIRDITGDDAAKRGEQLSVIISETDRLTALVSDLLQLSRIQNQNAPLERVVFDLAETVRRATKSFDLLALRDGYHFDCDIDDLSLVDGNEQQLEQVVYNLIGNAVNYTGADKKVRVSLKQEGTRVVFRVSDTGEGMDEEQLRHIWQRYYRASEHKRSVVGTGLGLSIVQTVLTRHEAEFGVESTVGAGSTFWFALPIAAGNAK